MSAKGHLRADNQAAFTLVEVVTALGVGMLVVGAIASFQNYQAETLRAQANQIDLQGTTRSIIDLVARDIRHTGRNPGCQATIEGLAIASSSTLQLQSDLDGSKALDAPNENVIYLWDKRLRALIRLDRVTASTVTKDSILISDVDVEGSAFHYFDANGNELDAGTGLDLTKRNLVRRIRIDLVIADHSGDLPARARASTNVDLRNRFFVAENALCPPAIPPSTT